MVRADAQTHSSYHTYDTILLLCQCQSALEAEAKGC